MRRALLAVLALAACDAAPARKLPGASLVPRFAARSAPRACGDDIAIDGGSTPALRYRFDYDALGRLAIAVGTFTSGGPDETIEYTYDHLGHTTHIVQARAAAATEDEIVADYDTLGDLVDYTLTAESAPAQRYAYASFDSAGQPTAETYSQTGRPDLSLQLEYDSSERIERVTGDDGSVTTYTYDDDGRTLTVDTGAGAWHGVIDYDDRARELSESWDGTALGAIANATEYTWNGELLTTATYRSGSQVAPHDLATVEVDTYRYDCP
jgi:YD repeat-containing protein